jgi:flavin-binding protein dodecin
MARSYFQPNYPVEVVARSRRGLLDAVRQALSGASRTMGTLERCEATIMPQIVRNGTEKHFQIMISVTKRDSENASSH